MSLVAPRQNLARAAVVVTAAIFGMTYSLSAALIALDLASQGFSESLIGANAAMHALGVFGMAFLLPRLVARTGIRVAVVGALLCAAALLLAFPLLPYVALWFALRVFLGAASEVLFVLSETWLNSLTTDHTRARLMGVYTAALSVGFALGPILLSVVGSEGVLPYAIGSALALAAAICVCSPSLPTPVFTAPDHGNPMRYMRLAPIAIGATVLNAAIETAGLTFLALYAIGLGWEESRAAQLMSVMMIGAIVLQLPVGWLGDHMDRRRLILILAALAMLGALVWPLAVGHTGVMFTLLFLWGGVFVGIYTIMLSIVGSQFQGSTLVGIYAAMGLMWGVGALIGPVMAGGAMQITLHGLPWFVALACGVFLVFAWRWRGVAKPATSATSARGPSHD